MKKNILFILPVALLSACAGNGSDSGFELKGTLNKSNGETIFLEQMAPDGLKKIDSVKLDAKGGFVMKPIIKEIGFYRLKISPKNFATLIFDAGQKVTVNGDAGDLGNTYTVEGSPDSKLFWDINKESATNYRQRDSLQKTFQAYVNMAKMDSIRIDSMSKALETPYNELVKVHDKYLQDFIIKNPTSFAALAAVQQLPPEQFMDVYIKLDESLMSKYPNSAYAKAYHENVTSHTKIAIGRPAPEITMNSPEGQSLSLSALKGKVVLIDFWASWCSPCRAENPNVVNAYNTYKSKGFDVFSVSLDKDMDKWKGAIQKDNLSWSNHVCDFQGWGSPVVKLYNFNSIPSNVLIDKNGIILGINLRGDDLEKKLEEVFK